MKMTVVWLRVAGEEGHILGLGAGVVEVNEIDSALVLYRRGKGRHGRGRGRGKGRSYEISTSENASLGDSQKVCHSLTSFFSKSPCILANSSCNFTPSILLSSFSNLTNDNLLPLYQEQPCYFQPPNFCI